MTGNLLDHDCGRTGRKLLAEGQPAGTTRRCPACDALWFVGDITDAKRPSWLATARRRLRRCFG